MIYGVKRGASGTSVRLARGHGAWGMHGRSGEKREGGKEERLCMEGMQGGGEKRDGGKEWRKEGGKKEGGKEGWKKEGKIERRHGRRKRRDKDEEREGDNEEIKRKEGRKGGRIEGAKEKRDSKITPPTRRSSLAPEPTSSSVFASPSGEHCM